MIFVDKMCSGSSLHRHNTLNGLVDPFSFSALNFLRTYNRLLGPNELAQCYNLTLLKESRTQQERNINLQLPILPPLGNISILQSSPQHNISTNINNTNTNTTTSSSSSSSLRCELNETTTTHQQNNNNTITIGINNNFRSQSPNRTAVSSTCPSTPPDQQNSFSSDYHVEQTNTFCGNLTDVSLSPGFNRRQRGEKRPIPDEQKDEKYYERRKRNNEAAKKSRDARKMREDRVAFRAAMLEQENSLLRAQVLALRDEITTLRQLFARTNTQI